MHGVVFKASSYNARDELNERMLSNVGFFGEIYITVLFVPRQH